MSVTRYGYPENGCSVLKNEAVIVRFCMDSAVETARRILRDECLLIEISAQRASRLHNARAVHDLRVSIRRFRTALRFFGDLLPRGSSKRLRRHLQELNRRLGPIRDAQVWLEFLKRSVRGKRTPLPDDWGRCLQDAEAACTEQVRRLDSILKSACFKDAHEYCYGIWRGKRKPDQSARPFMARKLYRATIGILRIDGPAATKMDKEAHALRRRCRRVRYLSEFAEPALGRLVRRLARRLKHVADSLGDRHDAEIHAGILNEMRAAPDDLRRKVSRRSHRARKEFDVAWRRLTAPHFQRLVLAALREAKRSTT